MNDIINIDLHPDRVVLSADVRVRREDRGWTLAPVPSSAVRWASVLERLADRVVRIAVYAPRKRRTLAQNSYLWAGVYRDILDGMRRHCFEAGVPCPFRDEDDVHCWAKYRFLRSEHVLPGGELLEFPPSTTVLDTQQFSDYVELICAWATEPPRGIYVHTPEDFWRDAGKIA